MLSWSRSTLHIIDTLILPTMILKIVSFHDVPIIRAACPAQSAFRENYGRRNFSKLWREGSMYPYVIWIRVGSSRFKSKVILLLLFKNAEMNIFSIEKKRKKTKCPITQSTTTKECLLLGLDIAAPKLRICSLLDCFVYSVMIIGYR